MCGGTSSVSKLSASQLGLSPRVRGNPSGHKGAGLYPGSIPACAGEPQSEPHSSLSCAVYPRVCGGTGSTSAAWDFSEGLSPRVRGNPPALFSASHTERSIPACAGEPSRPCPRAITKWVYPRVCGGTAPALDAAPCAEGLSPRVRGNLDRGRYNRIVARSIPACAGEPKAVVGRINRNRVYPRVCGGTVPVSNVPRTCQGLSPRVRGNRKMLEKKTKVERSIPACAGEP